MNRFRHLRRHNRGAIIQAFDVSATPMPSLVRLWLLRLLVPLGRAQHAITKRGLDNRELAVFIAAGVGRKRGAPMNAQGKLPSWLTNDDSDAEKRMEKKVCARLHELYVEAEQKAGCATLPATFRRNMDGVSKLAGLNKDERRVLEFAVFLHTIEPLKEAAEWLGDLNSGDVCRVLSKVLATPLGRVKRVLTKKGTLQDCGLLKLEDGLHDLDYKLDPLDCLAERMMVRNMTPETLLKDMVALGEAPQLGIKNYPHITRDLKTLRAYLKRASMRKKRGVNILLYGPPGTGKTQLARVLASELGCELFEVIGNGSDTDGRPLTRGGRLSAYNAAQCFFAKRRALILFDEAEDVFGWASPWDFLFGSRERETDEGKGGINRMLEQSRLPTIWISNTVGGLDPAYTRRFDMVVELPVPPKSVRERIMRDACGDFIDANAVSRIAESKELAPAVVTRASNVVGLIRRDLKANEVAPAFESLINNVLEVQRHRPIKRDDPNRLPETYDPAFINADQDMQKIADALVKVKQGRLCLYGAPGTGKTAYGRWIAERLDVPLLVKRASDLLSMWVGEAEKNIAKAFREAERENAVLLIDEMDSFLRDRRSAERSWEVTQVNEMLTQIESCAGVFIASTNLMDGLDQAALRRFDFKIKFDFLRAEQSWGLLKKHCATLNLPAPDRTLWARVKRIINLAPGDFATVARQSKLRAIRNATEFVAVLEEECALKDGPKSAMGFRT